MRYDVSKVTIEDKKTRLFSYLHNAGTMLATIGEYSFSIASKYRDTSRPP